MTRVLIVEDHQGLSRSLRRGLEVLEFEVVTAETGEEGFAMALEQQVDIVVLDLMLPGRNGIEILIDLRSSGFSRPILILTAKDSPVERQRARDGGANGFLAKPFAFAEFVDSLRRLLSPLGPPPGELL